MSLEVRSGFPGAVRIILLRFVMLLVLSVPAGVAARHAIAEGPGRDPRIVAQGLDLSVGMIRSAMRAAAPLYGGVGAAGLLGFLLFDQLLAAAALLILSRPPAGPLHIWRTVWDDAMRYLPRFVRLWVIVVVLTAVGGVALRQPVAELQGYAAREGWTGTTTTAVTVAGRGLVIALWGFFLGALARWSRALMVADDRHKARRALVGAARLAWRMPFRTVGLFVLVPLVLHLAGGLLLVLMFSHLRDPLAEQLTLCGWWAGYLLIVSTVWYLLLHHARVMIARERFDDIRVLW